MKYLAHLAIRFYQKFISPYKGFRCAHAALYKGDSCSEAVRKIVMEQGVFAGLRQIKARFSACTSAYETLRLQQDENEKRRDKGRCGNCKEKTGDACAEVGMQCTTSSCKTPFKSCDIDLPCDCSLF